MALVKVINRGYDIQLFQKSYTADAEKYFLLNARTLVASVKLAGNLPVSRVIFLDISVQEID